MDHVYVNFIRKLLQKVDGYLEPAEDVTLPDLVHALRWVQIALFFLLDRMDPPVQGPGAAIWRVPEVPDATPTDDKTAPKNAQETLFDKGENP